MTKVKKLVSKVTIINMYYMYSFIHPYLTYVSILWGNNYYSPIYDVVLLQNKAIRVINDVPIMDNITPHYVNLGILKFPDIVKLHTFLLFFDLLCDENNIAIPLAMSLYDNDIFPFTEQTSESSLPLILPFFLERSSPFHPL